MNNKALINGEWLQVHDEIKDYKVKTIRPDSVVLADDKGKLELFINEKTEKIKIQVR